MKLRDVPDPVWYGLLAIVAAGGVYWLTRRTAGAVGRGVAVTAQAFNPASDKNLIYDFIGTDEDGDTLGTAIYGAVDTVAGWFGMSDADKQRKAEEEARALRNSGDKPATSGATGSWSANGPYDYGTSGTSGVPWSTQAKPLPDLFNFSLDYIR